MILHLQSQMESSLLLPTQKCIPNMKTVSTEFHKNLAHTSPYKFTFSTWSSIHQGQNAMATGYLISLRLEMVIPMNLYWLGNSVAPISQALYSHHTITFGSGKRRLSFLLVKQHIKTLFADSNQTGIIAGILHLASCSLSQLREFKVKYIHYLWTIRELQI